MKRLLCVLFAVGLIGCKAKTDPPYRVATKYDANFTVALMVLYPGEKLLVKVNNETLLDTIGGFPGGLDSHLYFNYPKKIKTISAVGIYKGKETFKAFFKDTLLNELKRTLIIPFPSPKNLDRKNYERQQKNIPWEDTERDIKLIRDDAYSNSAVSL